MISSVETLATIFLISGSSYARRENLEPSLKDMTLSSPVAFSSSAALEWSAPTLFILRFEDAFMYKKFFGLYMKAIAKRSDLATSLVLSSLVLYYRP